MKTFNSISLIILFVATYVSTLPAMALTSAQQKKLTRIYYILADSDRLLRGGIQESERNAAANLKKELDGIIVDLESVLKTRSPAFLHRVQALSVELNESIANINSTGEMASLPIEAVKPRPSYLRRDAAMAKFMNCAEDLSRNLKRHQGSYSSKHDYFIVMANRNEGDRRNPGFYIYGDNGYIFHSVETITNSCEAFRVGDIGGLGYDMGYPSQSDSALISVFRFGFRDRSHGNVYRYVLYTSKDFTSRIESDPHLAEDGSILPMNTGRNFAPESIPRSCTFTSPTFALDAQAKTELVETLVKMVEEQHPNYQERQGPPRPGFPMPKTRPNVRNFLGALDTCEEIGDTTLNAAIQAQRTKFGVPGTATGLAAKEKSAKGAERP